MTVNGHPRIAFDPAVCGGRRTAAGTRVRVSDVLEMLAGGASEAEIVKDFAYLSVEDIRACLAYGPAPPREIRDCPSFQASRPLPAPDWFTRRREGREEGEPVTLRVLRAFA